ncbi:glycosyltransferase family protein [Halosimplex halophilum]|uniref:hypothetical protein n=1 Tax=Halosimplex halophilum TaxID=2559572 RepID=UPI0014354F1E|nr:hypothetical protein [Halosimplex halophilum]
MSRGVLYMAVGEQFVREAVQSAASVRKQMPTVDITLATDSEDYDLDPFDRVIELDQASQETIEDRTWLIDSTIGPDLSPYEKTLYLDSDTYVCNDISELFDLLEQYDLAIARTPAKPQLSDLPEPWHLYNCGVIAYRDTTETRELLNDWQQRYRAELAEQDRPVDQPAFVRALWDSDVRWFTLPQEYNVRIPNRGAVANEVKIVHGRHPAGLEQAADELNRHSRLRTYREHSYSGKPIFTVRNVATLRYRIERKIRQEGIVATLRRAPGFLVERLLGTD